VVAPGAAVLVGGDEFPLGDDQPFVFGRVDAAGVVGLDANDMGISAIAGSIEWAWGLWWVVNRSTKRPLLLDIGDGSPPLRLPCGARHAVGVARLSVLVPGVIFTHRLEVVLPEATAIPLEPGRASSGTITGDLTLTERDHDVVVALFSGYLEVFPRRQARPRTYQQAADLLGRPWTKTSVRKQLERLKERLAAAGTYFEGPQANFDLADHLILNGLLTPTDLERLPRGP
jgi:hypothetical protein